VSSALDPDLALLTIVVASDTAEHADGAGNNSMINPGS
jgi:hypothetical protein